MSRVLNICHAKSVCDKIIYAVRVNKLESTSSTNEYPW